MSFNYDKLKQKQESGEQWASYSDLFMVLSVVFLLLYVVASLRTGTHTLSQQLEKRDMANRVEDLQQQIKVYNTLKENYLEKQAEMQEQEVYENLMSKLELLQDKNGAEAESLRRKAQENEEKKEALNQYQQIIRNIINANVLAKARIKRRDDVITTQKDEIVVKDQDIQEKTEKIIENTRTIASKEKTILEKAREIAKKNETIQKKTQEIESRDQTIQDKLRAIKLRDQTIASKEQTIKQREQEITKLDQEVEQKMNIISAKDKVIEEKQKVLAAKQNQIESLNKDIKTKQRTISRNKKKINKIDNKLKRQISQLLKEKKKRKMSTKKYKQRLAKLRSQSAQEKKSLEAKQRKARQQLQSVQQKVAQASAQLENANKTIEEQSQQKDQLSKELENVQDKIVETKKVFETKVKDLNQKVSKVSDDLKKAQAKLNARKKLAKQIQKNFAKAGVKATVDGKTGDVILAFGSNYFDTGHSRLKPGMQKTLNKFVPIYATSLFQDPNIAKKIKSVDVVGFASPTYRGKYVNPNSLDPKDKKAIKYNLDLSYRRARSIFEHMFDTNKLKFSKQKDLLPLVKVSAKSFFTGNKGRMPASNMSRNDFCKQYDCKKEQRVIIKFDLNE